jgi:integrase
MATSKASSAVPDDRSGAPQVDIPAHTGLSASRGVGSPGVSTKLASTSGPMSRSCAGLSPNSVWQSPGGATASLVVTFDETPRTILGTSDRNPRETQPGASYSPEGHAEPDTSWRPAFERWRVYLAGRRRPATVKAYVRDVERTLTAIGKPDLRSIAWVDLDSYWQAYVAANGPRKGPTYNRWVTSLKNFYGFVVDKLDLPIRDLGRKLDMISTEEIQRSKTQHPVLSKDEVQRILAAADAHADDRFSLALRFKWTGICRLEDVWSLTWAQLDLTPSKAKAFYARPSKHGHDLTKLLDDGLAKRLRDWRRLRQPADADPVFREPPTMKSLYQRWFTRRLRGYAAEARVTRYTHPHLIRASSRTSARMQGAPKEFLDRQGGWKVHDASDGYDRWDPETMRKWVKTLALD